MPARPKYQIFISSTYSDLREEREAVTWAILSSRHIPAGMENFTATDDRGWQTITSVIDRSDYYVLLLAGRYGSVAEDGKSWTEKEYDYAISKGIPVLAFVRSKEAITGDKLEENPRSRKKLGVFLKKVTDMRLAKFWATKEELVGHVVNAVHNHISNDEDDSKRTRPGWYRGDELPSFNTLEEFARVSSENASLRAEIESVRAVESKPRLRLVDRAGELLPKELVAERKLSVYGSPYRSLAELASRSYWSDDLTLNIVQVLRLGVENISGSLVDQVTVDLTLKSISGFYCGWGGQKLLDGGGELNNSSIKDEYRHKYPKLISQIDESTVMIRVKIPSVPAGGIEYLPSVLVLGTVKENTSSFELSYKIVGNAGLPQAGTVSYRILFEGTNDLDSTAQYRDKLNLEKARGTIILKDMLLKSAM